MLSTHEITRYAQHIKLENIGLSGQLKLKNARVLCVGAGGLASPLLLYLAASGVGTLGIVDNDQVELSNLQRQVLYQDQHVGQKKVAIAQQQILALNPDVNVITHLVRLSAENAKEIISSYDIIADCTDNFATRYLINDTCFLLDKPFSSASIAQFEGQCTLFLGKKGPCYRCLFPLSLNKKTIPNCSEGGVLGVLPGILGMVQAAEIVKFILGIGEGLSGRLWLFDLLKMQSREIHYAQNPACELCVQQNVPSFLYPQEDCSMNNEISVQELHDRLSQKEPIFLLDVRTIEERNSYNIGGTFIPLLELSERVNELDPNVHIVTYCRSGGRSLQAVEILNDAGFKSVRSLRGGVTEVQMSGLNFV